MFAKRYFPQRFFPAAFFPQGATVTPATLGDPPFSAAFETVEHSATLEVATYTATIER